MVTLNVLWLFLAAPWVGLQCVIVVFPDHTHLLSGCWRGTIADLCFKNLNLLIYDHIAHVMSIYLYILLTFIDYISLRIS